MLYNFIEVTDQTHTATLQKKLREAQAEIRRIYENPLPFFYRGLKTQLDRLSEQMNTDENLLDLTDTSGKTDRIMNILNRAEPLTRMIESIGTKNFPEIFKEAGNELPGNDAYILQREKEREKVRKAIKDAK